MKKANAPGAGLFVAYGEPIWKNGRLALVDRLARLETYNHVISADGWYISMQTGGASTIQDVTAWLRGGLGFDIWAQSFGLTKVWRGFVNQIEAQVGKVSYSVGPLVELENDITVVYNEIETGLASVSPHSIDAISQEQYGKWQKVLNGGTISDARADDLRSTRLLEYRNPRRTETYTATGNAISLTLNCLGYQALLNYVYTYNSSGSITIRNKIIAVLGASPNTIFNTIYTMLENNTLEVDTREDRSAKADSIIKEMVAMGGSSDDRRRIFGIGPELTPYHRAIPTEIGYHGEILNGGTITYEESSPQLITPDKFVFYTDIDPARIGPPVLDGTDSRVRYIETVNFSYPAELSLTDGRNDTISQKLAKLGLGSG